MKYTRYDIKKDNSNRIYVCIVVVFVFILALLIAAILAPFISKNMGSLVIDSVEKENKNKIIEVEKIVLVQCGSFQKKENAMSFQMQLNSKNINSTIINDLEKYKVCIGIFTEEETDGILKELQSKSIENSKIAFKIKKDNLCDKEIYEMINADLQIINKLSDGSIRAINTDELKNWTSSLTKVDESSINYSVKEELKKHILEYPKELTKDNIQENYTYLIQILRKIK